MNTAVIIISHSIQSPQAKEDFQHLIGNLSARTPGCIVRGVYLDNEGRGLSEQISGLSAQGISTFQVIPYFLHNAGHARKDITFMVDKACKDFPDIDITLSSGLWCEPLVEDALWEKIAAFSTSSDTLPQTGPEIEHLSHTIIEGRLAFSGFADKEKAVTKRVIHATADFSFAQSMFFHPDAVENAIDAISGGADIYCDVTMVRQGMTKLDNRIICGISEPDVINYANANNCTRAAAAIDYYDQKLNGAVVVVGNAPTTIWRLLQRDDLKPAVVIGLPVGFVGARESKRALAQSGRICITNTSPRGGSPAAAAAMNALALLSRL